MGFVELLIVASFPVIKLLLMTVLGLFLALDRINLLGEIARSHLNNIVFYVFNPALVGSNLANTITYESFISLWFMPVNILGTFVLGSALGWIIIKLTRTPKHLEGLVLGCCSAGNLGNLPIIIIPAMCKEKGSPFGDPDLCYKYGMGYASLSMAIGSFYIWSYVYNIMRISSKKIPRIDNGNDDDDDSSKLKYSEENTETFPETCTEAQSPAKGESDDAYIMLLPNAEPEEKPKVTFLQKMKQNLGKMLSNLNIKSMLAPPTVGAIAGFCIGVISPLRRIMIGSDAPLRVIQDAASMLGDANIPSVTLILGANLLKGLKGTGSLLPTLVAIIAVRYILLPIAGVLVIKGAIHMGAVQSSDPLYQFMLLLQYALPPAMNIGTIAQLYGAGETECSVIMLWTYALASVAVTLWSTFFMWLVA